MSPWEIARRGFAAWRLADMLVNETGPGNVFTRLRTLSGIEDRFGVQMHTNDWTPLHCIYCTGIYTSVLLAVAPKFLVDVLVLSGIVTLIELRLDR